ncbi:MAG TPA: 3'(2'),5'-bisphosphate nucleotidase CysQ [Rhodospirillaceae bacterium]|nr:3'(2'),5'-bisphosphate nucleotidase CysQ [Rhodospirillaceae bacterium]
MTDYDDLLTPLGRLARQAGDAILEVYAADFRVTAKSDSSPVTEADLRAEGIILAGLARLTPEIPVISEEAAAAGSLPELSGSRFWLVDPLDGTKEFVKRNGEFTVNIALVEDGRPVLGVLLAPVLSRLFCGRPGRATQADGTSPAHPIQCRDAPKGGLVVLSSRSHRDPDRFAEFTGRFPVAEVRQSGSSLKFALIATGEADLYPRFGPTCEWDTAAGQAILEAAGGRVTDAEGNRLDYGKPGFANPSFIAWGKVS